MASNATRTLSADRQAGLATVPAEALMLQSGPFKFADGEAKDGKFAVRMRARSGQPIYHWYWGNVVHDMAGFTPAEPTIPIDYCHWNDEVLGYLNKFEPSNDGLDVAGELVGFGQTDRTAEVAHKARAGVPYQASMFFEAHVLEEVMAGAAIEVNGYKLAGPGVVIRKWALRGVAVCPYGYDPKTQTKLSAAAAGEIPVQFVSHQESAMELKPTVPAAEKPATELATKPAEAATGNPPPATDPRAEFKATLAKFTEKFGAESGAKWAAEGLTYEAALEKHSEVLATQLKTKDTELADAQKKLGAVPRGEEAPVSFATNDKHEGGQTVPAQFNGLGKLGKFAASLKMPGK